MAFVLKSVDFAGKDGANVALQGGAVDASSCDRLAVGGEAPGHGRRFHLCAAFAHHRRVDGAPERFRASRPSPTSKARSSALAAAPPTRSWIILRAYAQKTAGFDPRARRDAGIRRAAAVERDAETRRRAGGAQFLAIRCAPRRDAVPSSSLPGRNHAAGARPARRHAAARLGVQRPLGQGQSRRRSRAISPRRTEARTSLLAVTRPAEWQAIRKMTGAADDCHAGAAAHRLSTRHHRPREPPRRGATPAPRRRRW